MKISRVIIISILLPLSAQCAWAGGRDGDQILGGMVGGVFGGLIGNEVGGRDGAIVGVGLGALTGVALTQGGHDRGGYYEERHYRGHDDYYRGRGHYERHDYDRGYYGRHESYEDHDRGYRHGRYDRD